MFATPQDHITEYSAKYEEPAMHYEALKRAHIITLDINPRELFPLCESGVITVADLIRAQRAGLTKIRQIGTSAARKVEKKLKQADLLRIEV